MSELNCPQLNQFNKLLEQAREKFSCDAECQRRKTAQELKDKYDELLNRDCKKELREAEKNYIVFTKGQNVYDDILYEQLNEKAEENNNSFLANFNKDGKKITTDINSYS